MFVPTVSPSSSSSPSQMSSTMGFFVADPKEQFSLWKEFASVIKAPSWGRRRRDSRPDESERRRSCDSVTLVDGSSPALAWNPTK
ncbi:hypothetical protein FRB90_000685 [Tulasnella sp. 427]|nr:hypothetical protein FRB90_000685 [Tulasnella sp. 427]